MTSSWTPKPGNGLPSREPCSSCGKTGDKWMRRGWCAACYQRWDNNGRPEGGPVRVYLPRTSGTGTCAACGAEDVIRKTANEWCHPCYDRWQASGKPASGPPPRQRRPRGTPPPPKKALGRPPAPVGQCPICDRIGPLHRDGWCRVCDKQNRGRGRRGRQLEKLTRLRLMWALARPGDPNPYECPAPGCHETADPRYRHHCAMHEGRFRHNGTYDGPVCVRCGADPRKRGRGANEAKLCDPCKEVWGYCGDSTHQGERLVWRQAMAGSQKTQCKSCANRRAREKRRAQGIPSREERIAQARRAIIAEMAASAALGDLITHQVLADALNLDTDKRRDKIHAAVSHARRTLLRDHDRTLITIRSRGYRVMPARRP